MTNQPSGWNWDTIAQDVSSIVNALAPVVTVLDPAISGAVAIGTKIIQGVLNEEPAALALFQQITNGKPPTAAQLQAYAGDYEAAYQKLNADINAKLAAAI